jgi:hypothetical protein
VQWYLHVQRGRRNHRNYPQWVVGLSADLINPNNKVFGIRKIYLPVCRQKQRLEFGHNAPLSTRSAVSPRFYNHRFHFGDSTGSASGDSNVSASGVSNVSASGASTASTTPPPLAPTTFTLTPPPEYRYEEQDRCLCAMHALNNLRAATWATVEMMQEAAGGRRDQNGRTQGPGSGYTMLTVEKVLAKRGVRTYERNVRNGNRERLVQGEQWAEVCGGRWGQGAIIHTACDLQQG